MKKQKRLKREKNFAIFRNVVQVSTVAIDGANFVLQVESILKRSPDVLNKRTLKIKNADKLASIGGKSATGLTLKNIGAGITIATDVLDTVKDMLEDAELRGKVEKNYSDLK